jgi:hypothetical protein
MTTEEPQSKITDEHRAFIGRRSEPVAVTVREEDARRLRTILGDDDPRWAEGRGIAPPYVLAMFGGAPRRGTMPSILPGGIMTQQEWRFTRPFRIGEELQAITQVIDIRERLGGRYGHSVLITTSTDFYDDRNEHVAANLLTVTQFDPSAARSSGSE